MASYAPTLVSLVQFVFTLEEAQKVKRVTINYNCGERAENPQEYYVLPIHSHQTKKGGAAFCFQEC